MTFQAEKRVQGVSPVLLKQYRAISTSTIGHLTDVGYLVGLQPLYRPIRLLGNAVTVRIPPVDGSAIRQALTLAQPGDVLVIDMSGDEQRACWGEFRTYAAIKKQLAGVIIGGCVTDVQAIAPLGLPVFSKGISAITTRAFQQEANGQVNTTINICDVSIAPGDLIIGDDDGVFVVKPHDAERIAAAAMEKQRQEAMKRQAMNLDIDS